MIDLILVIFCLTVILLLPPTGVLIAFAAVLVYLLAGRERRRRFASIGFKPVENVPRVIGICLGLGVLIELTAQIVVNPVVERITSSGIDLAAYDPVRGNAANWLTMLLVGWVIGGFVEEILFRGFLLTRISDALGGRRAGDIAAIAVTSAAFGFGHLYQGWSGALSTGLISVVFGIIFVRAGRNLWYPILIHGFVNMTSLTLIFLDVDRRLGGLIF